MKKIHKILIEKIIKNKKNIYYMILRDFNMILNKKLDMSREGKRNIDSSTRITKWLKSTNYIEVFRFCNLGLTKYS